MTSTQRRALEKYIRYLLRALDLSDWAIAIKEPLDADDEAWARITPTYGQRRAALSLCPDFEQLPPEKARGILVHELVHCHTSGIQHHVESDELEGLLGKGASLLWVGAARQFIEGAVDAIAVVIARHLDVIDWTGASRYRT